MITRVSICHAKKPVREECYSIWTLQRTKYISKTDGTWKICLIYLDGVIVIGRTFVEELEQLKQLMSSNLSSFT